MQQDGNLGKDPLFWEGVRYGRTHSIPSPETVKEFRDMKNDISENHKEVMGEIKEIKETMVDFDKRSVTWDYSSKGFFALVGLVLTSFFVAVINFFIK